MRFSILMCTYNSAETLAHAIDSVLMQKCEEWELIILDNGSQDETVSILEHYRLQDERIQCVYREDNVGWCKGISLCLEQASGEYMMFLGADDYLYHESTLLDIKKEIMGYQPDIIWTGLGLAEYVNGEYIIHEHYVPEYKRYEQETKLVQLNEIMSNVLYNSVMHYVRIEFLKEHNIDFFEPYYGDCQGITEALCKAKRMVVLDKPEYVLTVNTSKTASKVCFEYDYTRQWRSIRECLKKEGRFIQSDELGYIAERVLINLAGMYEHILMGEALRDIYMNDITVGLAERFLKAEEWLSDEDFSELIKYAGQQKWKKELLGIAGVLYYTCAKYDGVYSQMHNNSKWLAEYLKKNMECLDTGEICWKEGVE